MGNPVEVGYVSTEPLELDINLDNIMKGIQDWESVIDAVEIGVQLGIEELCDRLRDKMIDNLDNYGLGDSNIANTIIVEPMGDGISVSVGSDYAVYVEYGTGVVGEGHQHPRATLDGWVYDVNEHGEEGWWYPTTTSDPNKKKKTSKDGGLWAWTKGQASRPFMYETWLWGTRSATQIIRKNIRREVKKVNGVR